MVIGEHSSPRLAFPHVKIYIDSRSYLYLSCQAKASYRNSLTLGLPKLLFEVKRCVEDAPARKMIQGRTTTSLVTNSKCESRVFSSYRRSSRRKSESQCRIAPVSLPPPAAFFLRSYHTVLSNSSLTQFAGTSVQRISEVRRMEISIELLP